VPVCARTVCIYVTGRRQNKNLSLSVNSVQIQKKKKKKKKGVLLSLSRAVLPNGPDGGRQKVCVCVC